MTLPLWPFSTTVPAGPNNPSDDQPVMLQNNQSDSSIWATDHFGYNVNSGGYHQQTRMANRTTYPLAPNPPTVISGFGGTYCDNGSSTTPLNETNLWYTPDNGGGKSPKEIYQLTRTVSASYPLFAKLTNNYNGVGTTFFGGWTFLPGGILMQYGSYRGMVSGNPGIPNPIPQIPFPVTFNSLPFNIQITQISASGGISNSNLASVTTRATTFFNWNFTSVPTNAYIGIDWVAIGL